MGRWSNSPMTKDGEGKHTHNFKTRGSLDIKSPVSGIDEEPEDPTEKPKTETDAIGNHDDIDKRPQRLQVAYYCRCDSGMRKTFAIPAVPLNQ